MRFLPTNVVRILSVFYSLGCESGYTTESTEVGVRTRKLFGAGIEPHIYEPGDVHVLSVDVRTGRRLTS